MNDIEDEKYEPKIDSVSLKKIDGMFFTITDVEESDYVEYVNGAETTTKGVQITTKESYTVEGKAENKFHTTRVKVVEKLLGKQFLEDLKTEGFEPVVCVKTPYTNKEGLDRSFFKLQSKKSYLSQNGSSGTQKELV
jgi:hypothetical protein